MASYGSTVVFLKIPKSRMPNVESSMRLLLQLGLLLLRIFVMQPGWLQEQVQSISASTRQLRLDTVELQP